MPAGDYYELLGVDPTASAVEIRAAYRRRAMVFHPDRHSAAPDDVQREAQRIMAALNAAYETLSDNERRRQYDADLTVGGPAEDVLRAVRPPAPGECWMCASTPAVDVSIHQHVGKLLWREKRVMEATLCRSCGRAMVAFGTNRTMVTGWWGAISFFANWVAIWHNWRAWRQVSALSPPKANPDRVVVPMPAPAPPTKPLLQWGGVWVTLALVGSLAGLGISEQQSASSGVRPASTVPVTGGGGSGRESPVSDTHAPASIYDLEGMCLRYDYSGQQIDDVVPCWESHDAEVVDVVSSPEGCYTDYYFVSPDGVLCVEE